MIPKIIHYCWYGRGKKDELAERCIASWKKYCPEYRIVEWNEDNCDVESSIWASEAYANKKWAFVSDFFRLKVMYEYGGVYMDTDVELFDNLDRFLEDENFVGLADDTYIGSGMFGCSKGSPFCKELLNYYEGRRYIKKNGVFNDIPNNQIYTAICMKKLGLKYGDSLISMGNTRVYPTEVFSPFKKRTIGRKAKIYDRSNFITTNETVAIHYTVYSWGKQNMLNRAKTFILELMRIVFPAKLYMKIKRKNNLQKIRNIEL